MTYKMVFSDIDGTLLNSQHTLSDTTKRAVSNVAEKGIFVVLGSGRQPSSVRLLSQELGLKTPVIGFSGALVRDENDQKIWERGLSKEQTLEIKKQVMEKFPDVLCSVYSDDLWIVDDDEHPVVKLEQSIVKATPVKGSPADLLPDDAVIHKLLCTGDSDELDRVQAYLIPLYPDCRIYKSQSRYLEIMNREAAKSLAAEVLCRLHNISPEHIIAFGDNYNDVDMLEFAGLGVAMGNAPDDVKKAAKLVTDTNDNDGVAVILAEKFN